MLIFEGQNSFEKLVRHVRNSCEHGVFVVSGKKSFDNSPAKAIIDDILAELDVSFFSEFSPNVKSEEALNGCKAFAQSKAEIILAVGGGSVIDMAKLISVGASEEQELLELVLGWKKPTSNTPIFCAPTTAGSGSEATHFAVVYVDGKKFSFADKRLTPEGIALDPLLSQSMPPYITACSGFDAISQAIESWWARGATPESRDYAKQALNLLIPNVVKAVVDPSLSTREAMAKGAFLAGQAINISKTTAPHAFSYHLTSRLSIPHGHAVALLLGYFFLVNESKLPQDLLKALGANTAKDCCDAWYSLMNQCGLETKLSALGIGKDGMIEMAKSVNAERLANNPVKLTSDDIHSTVSALGNLLG